MTRESTTKELVASQTDSAVDDALITDKTVINNPQHDYSAIRNFVDINQGKVLDEDFRLAVKKMLGESVTMPDNWNDLSVRAQRNWVYKEVRSQCKNLPDNLINLTVGLMINGDCNRPSDAVPEWLDRDKFQRGQHFAMNNYAGISLAEMLSLFTLFSFDNSLKPLILTGKSSDPFTAFKRYLSTGKRVRNWLTSDVWTQGTEGYKDIQTVRQMHANIRKKLDDSSIVEVDKAAIIPNSWSSKTTKIREDFQRSCPAAPPGQCGYIFSKEERFRRPRYLNQTQMAGTQFGFMGLVILYPEKFGIHDASDEDLDAYCHVWRGLGYLLGIEDEFNFCNGTLEEVKQRSREFLDYWVKVNLRDITPEWEHMMRCVVVGITYYFPASDYEINLLYLADMINIPMPRLRASLSYSAWIRLYILKFTFGVTIRIPGAMAVMNRTLNRCIDRGLALTEKELEVLRKRSEITLSKGIAETVTIEKDMGMTKSNVWNIAPFFVFSSAFLLLNLPIIVKEYASKLLRG